MPGHSENFCTQIMLESMDRLPPIQAGIQDILSNVIQRYYSNEQITSEHVQNAEQFVSQLETIVLKHANISIKIQPFGSLKSGFGTKRSDLDLCIMLLDDTKDHNNIEVGSNCGTKLLPFFRKKDSNYCGQLETLFCQTADSKSDRSLALKSPFSHSNSQKAIKLSKEIFVMRTNLLSTTQRCY